MSAAAAASDAAPPKGKKKLILIVAIVLVVVLVGGVGAALLLMKKGAAEGEEEEGSSKAKPTAAAKRDPKAPPAYVPLENFVVNLADRDAERYAQIGITLEMATAAEGEQIKVFMPAIRNNILMVLAHKRAAELLERSGKEQLAGEIQRAASRAMGIDIPEPDPEEETAQDEGTKKKPRKRKPAPPETPIVAVHFSSFIVQ